MPTRSFFATRADLEPGLVRIETRFDLKYVCKGVYDTADYPVYKSALDIPSLGVAKCDYVSGIEKFLVSLANAPMKVDAVAQVAVGTKYFIEFAGNDHSFWFQPGGTFRQVALIGGSLAPNATVPDVVQLFEKFARDVLLGFTRVKDRRPHTWYVGPHAMQMLRDGVKLVTDIADRLKLPDLHT